MATFSNAPPSDPRGIALPLTRTPSTGNLRALITSDDLIGCYTHFWKGRTLPCDVDDCAACAGGMPYRWHAWVSALTSQKRQHILFEMTAQVAEVFAEYKTANGTLRGALFDANRPSRRPNGRVCVQIKSQDLTGITLPTAPDLIKCLSIIWNIATPSFNVADLLKGVNRISVKDESQPIIHQANGDTKAG